MGESPSGSSKSLSPSEGGPCEDLSPNTATQGDITVDNVCECCEGAWHNYEYGGYWVAGKEWYWGPIGGMQCFLCSQGGYDYYAEGSISVECMEEPHPQAGKWKISTSYYNYDPDDCGNDPWCSKLCEVLVAVAYATTDELTLNGSGHFVGGPFELTDPLGPNPCECKFKVTFQG